MGPVRRIYKEESEIQCTLNEELQNLGQLRENEQNQLAWNLFEDLMKEKKLKNGCT